jgi:HTH-type transcriptional regulator / antitoxin HipB
MVRRSAASEKWGCHRLVCANVCFGAEAEKLCNVPIREHYSLSLQNANMLPYGNILLTFTPEKLEYSCTVTHLDGMKAMKYTPQDIGKLVRETRKGLGVTQKALALTSGTGLRFIIELERGKETAEIGKVLTILQTLGIQIALTPPPAATKRE